jgi:two-component SAPR family response regulator
LNVIAVDDEQYALMDLRFSVEKALPDCTLSCFLSPNKALAYAEDNQVDIAFVDIEMGGMNGIILAKNLKNIYGGTNIIFVTGHSQYAIDSYSVDTSDYLLKPVTTELVERALKRLRDPVMNVTNKRVRVQTFGNFEIFADEQPLMFAFAKTKELLAYLVHRRGAICSNNEIMAVIWEEREDTLSLKSQFRNLVSDLTKTLKEIDIEDILVKRRGHLGVNPDNFSCDIYDFSKAVPYAVNSYNGEYIAQYGWAEFTNAYLANIK